MLPTALARYIEAHGGKVMTEAPVDKFIVGDDGACCGRPARSRARRSSRSKGVVTGLGLKVSFIDCTEERHLSPDFVQACRNFSYGTVSIARVHFALKELPQLQERRRT